ncbi:ABC transporter ATP-binding protein [Nocardia sp. NPDC050630]|uniref:ABC transporter ATP-binding protein n=1 Tax=Nocardia sp. NPDC050630 TaxID=3364321 RepID=UPI00379B906F
MIGSWAGEKPPTFWGLAAPVLGRVRWAGVLAALGAVAGVLPVAVAVAMELARVVVPAAGGGVVEGPRVWWLVAALIGSVAVAQTLTMAGYGVSHVADAEFAQGLRQRQITHLLRLPLDWFSRTASGRVKKVVQDDVAKVHQLIAHVVPDVTNGIVRPVASVVLLFVVDWRLGLIALIPLMLAVASFPLFMTDISAQFDRYNAALAELGAAVVEFVRGIAPVKVFEVSGRGHRRFLDSAAGHYRFYRDWMEATVHGSALLLVFTSPGFAVTVSGVGATLLIAYGGLEPAGILPAVLLSANIAGPLFMLMQMRQFLREANGAAGELEAFFAMPAAADPDDTVAATGSEIAVVGVVFSYTDRTRAPDGVSMQLAPGTVVALVGASGSGKSTLAALVPRLLDPDAGVVRLGGADLRRLAPKQLYAAVGFVFQQPYLLRMSVRDNIALGRPDATDAQVVAAATAAQIHDRIARLPQGYATIVGDDARLSGGERQRLSIARALLMDTPVLVLDEATAFADPDSEADIQRALAELTRGRPLLVIAHRLHTVTGTDQILVLDHGRVVEHGSHATLIAADGLYARMWHTYQQARDFAPRSRIGNTEEPA